jgi:hypothetical protein
MEKKPVEAQLDWARMSEVMRLVAPDGHPLLLPKPAQAETSRTEREIIATLGGFKKGKGQVWEREIEDGVVLKIAAIEPGSGNNPLSVIACVILSRYADGYERPLAAFEFRTVAELLESLSVARRR